MYRLHKLIFLLATTATLSFLLCWHVQPLRGFLESYSRTSMEQQLGNKKIKAEHEDFVRAIAQEMGVTKPIEVRHMGVAVLHCSQGAFYANAFVMFPILLAGQWPLLPAPGVPTLYISQGFFEGLTQAEQRFLIGHELIHIDQEHNRFITLYTWLMLLLFLVWILCVVPWVTKMVRAYVVPSQQVGVRVGLLSISLLIMMCGPGLTVLHYRRSAEWQADRESTHLLQTYEGGIKCMERFVREFRQPADFGWKWFLADHPSSAERRNYFIDNQTTTA